MSPRAYSTTESPTPGHDFWTSRPRGFDGDATQSRWGRGLASVQPAPQAKAQKRRGRARTPQCAGAALGVLAEPRTVRTAARGGNNDASWSTRCKPVRSRRRCVWVAPTCHSRGRGRDAEALLCRHLRVSAAPKRKVMGGHHISGIKEERRLYQAFPCAAAAAVPGSPLRPARGRSLCNAMPRGPVWILSMRDRKWRPPYPRALCFNSWGGADRSPRPPGKYATIGGRANGSPPPQRCLEEPGQDAQP